MESPRDLYEPLVTPRLELREPLAEHAPLMFEAFSSDPEVTRYLRWRPHRVLSDADSAMALRLERLRDSSELSWVVFLRTPDSVVGIVSLWASPPAAELGFAFSRRAWGRGLATEAARAVLEWSFRRLSLKRVWASCDFENASSQHVLEKLGMVRERLAQGFAVHPNLGDAPRDCFVYGVQSAA